MTTALLPRLAVVTVAAMGMYVPTLGLPLPGTCLRTGAVASAAPSPSCASDLRDCLRKSADERQSVFGGRYVTAEDVALCTEIFKACIHGGASPGGLPPVSPASTAAAESMPNRFGIDHGGGAVSDCRLNGDSVSCTSNWKTADDSYDAQFTGTLSGMTMTGTTTTHRNGRTPADPGCLIDETYVGPVTYTFNPAGKVNFSSGPNQRQTTLSGSCSGSSSGATVVTRGTASWSALP